MLYCNLQVPDCPFKVFRPVLQFGETQISVSVLRMVFEKVVKHRAQRGHDTITDSIKHVDTFRRIEKRNGATAKKQCNEKPRKTVAAVARSPVISWKIKQQFHA